MDINGKWGLNNFEIGFGKSMHDPSDSVQIRSITILDGRKRYYYQLDAVVLNDLTLMLEPTLTETTDQLVRIKFFKSPGWPP